MSDINKSKSEIINNEKNAINGQTNPSFHDTPEDAKNYKSLQTINSDTNKKPSFVLKPSILTKKAEELRTDKAVMLSTLGNSAGGNKFLVLGGVNKSHNMQSTDDSIKVEQPSRGFVFGQNIFSRVVAKEGTSEEADKAREFSDLASDKVEEVKDGEVDSDALRKNAEVATQKLVTQQFEETEVVTGEEDELSAVKTSCKVFLFNSERQEWVEKGFCFVHVNDISTGGDCRKSRSRLVARSKGGLKVIINTFIWPDMVLTRASDKSLRISAQGDESVKSFLLTMLNGTDADNLYRELFHRKAAAESNVAEKKDRKRNFSGSDCSDDIETKRRIYSDDE